MVPSRRPITYRRHNRRENKNCTRENSSATPRQCRTYPALNSGTGPGRGTVPPPAYSHSVGSRRHEWLWGYYRVVVGRKPRPVSFLVDGVPLMLLPVLRAPPGDHRAVVTVRDRQCVVPPWIVPGSTHSRCVWVVVLLSVVVRRSVVVMLTTQQTETTIAAVCTDTAGPGRDSSARGTGSTAAGRRHPYGRSVLYYYWSWS